MALKLKRVSGWPQPSGMSDAGWSPSGIIPADPDSNPNAGESIDWIDYGSLIDPETGEKITRRQAYEKELTKYGDGLWLNPTTAAALEKFERTKVFKAKFSKQTRWGVRPFITNKLAGGIPDSYHSTGEAIDIQHSFNANNLRGQETKLLQDVLIQALSCGFRGIGFGPSQFHFDTRSSRGGFLGYIYQGWPSSVTPMYVMQSILRDRVVLRDGSRLSEEDIARIARDTPLTDVDSGRSGASRAQMSEADIQQYITPLYKNEREVLRPENRNFGRNALIGTAIIGVILGGIYGWRRFVANRKKKQEAERLLQDRKRRVIISRFRAENKRAINKAKNDPALARQLEDNLKAQFALYDVPFEEQT